MMLLLDYSRGNNQESRIYNIYSHWWIFQPAIRENRRKSSPAWHGPQHSSGCATSLPFYNPKPGVFFFWCRGGGSGVNSPSSFRVFSWVFFAPRSPADADQSILPLLAWYNGLDEPNGLATTAAYAESKAVVIWHAEWRSSIDFPEIPGFGNEKVGFFRRFFSPWFIIVFRKFGGDVQVSCFSEDLLFFWGDDGKIGRVYGLFLSPLPCWVGMRYRDGEKESLVAEESEECLFFVQ